MTKDNLIKYLEDINLTKSDRLLKQRAKIKKQEWFFKFEDKIPNHWLEVNFMDVTWLITCGVAKKPIYVEKGIPFLSAQNTRPFKTNLNKIKFITEEAFLKLTVGGKPEKNDVLYTRVGNCGEAASVPYEFDFGVYVSLTLIKPIHELIDHSFLVAFLNSNYGKIQANAGAIGIGLKNLNVESVRKYKIPLPPLSEQKAIVKKIEEVFSSLDSGIADLKKAQEQLKIYRQAVLKKAFEGELTKGQKLIELRNVISNIQAGKSFRCDERPPVDNEIGVLKVSSLSWGEFLELESKTVTDPTRINPNYFVEKGDFLLSRANTLELVGKSVIVNSISKKLMLSDKTLRISFNDLVVPHYILYFLKSRNGRKQIEDLSTGNQVSMRNIGQERIKQIRFPIPITTEVQTQIVKEIESRLSVCDKVEESIVEGLQKAQALRQSILKKAFEGKLLTKAEIAACKLDKDYEPASVLLESIRKEKK